MLRHNYHTGFAEIDLITLSKEKTIHFIEVKSWSEMNLTHPLETLNKRRIVKIRRAARNFLYELHLYKREEMAISARKIGISEFDSNIRVDELQNSFDLIWIKKNENIEYFDSIF